MIQVAAGSPVRPAGADGITVHGEAASHRHRTVSLIRDRGLRAGGSLNPATSLLLLEPILADIDLLLVMSVNPGFGGQKFIEGSLARIARAKALLSDGALLEVDGGGTVKQIRAIADAGADVFVAGSAIFGSGDRGPSLRAIRADPSSRSILSAPWPADTTERPEDALPRRPQEVEKMLPEILLSPLEAALQAEVRAFVRDGVSPELIRKMDRDEIPYPREFVRALGERNLLGLRFPVASGGRGLSWSAEIAALEEVGVLGTALGCAFSMPSIVGQALHSFGSAEQQQRFLRPLLRGELVAAEALTEPRGGSDFFGATTCAELRDGWFTVRGQKRFVVGAEGADFFIVYCNTAPGGKPRERISLLLIEKERPGVEVKYLYQLLGTRGGGTGRLLFRDVRVPAGNLIGDLHGGAAIFDTMMVPERLTSAAGSLGMARAALEVAARYSDRRKAFGQRIRNFEGVSFQVADAITRLDAARALAIAAGKSADAGLPSARRLVSEAKRFATDTAWHVCNLAMQVVGGIGYTNVLPIERLIRDTRLIQIWTGTNEIMSLLIQHEYYRELLGNPAPGRMIERDAGEAGRQDELVYDDDEMWTKGW